MTYNKLCYRIDEAVIALGIGRTKLYEKIAKRELKSFLVGGRRLIHHDDLMAFINKHRGLK